MSDGLHLDWSAAQVHGGELTVPLSGEVPDRFKRAFRHTVRLLGEHSGWSGIELHKGVVQVGEVSPGSEDALRHHLEAVVTQANAALAQAAEENSSEDTPAGGPDAEMTERFRGFGAGRGDQAD